MGTDTSWEESIIAMISEEDILRVLIKWLYKRGCNSRLV